VFTSLYTTTHSTRPLCGIVPLLISLTTVQLAPDISILMSLSLSCLSSSNHLHFRFDIFFLFPYRVLSKPKYPRTCFCCIKYHLFIFLFVIIQFFFLLVNRVYRYNSTKGVLMLRVCVNVSDSITF
jgi:hypothetical protein